MRCGMARSMPQQGPDLEKLIEKLMKEDEERRKTAILVDAEIHRRILVRTTWTVEAILLICEKLGIDPPPIPDGVREPEKRG